ncbi:MAG: 7-cyano-7-deazaguanine synthase QueC [Endomicrobiaceae bacterium]
MKKKAIILFSGGLDSTTVLYYAMSKKYDCHCLIFDYGQKHKKEVKNAEKMAKSLGLVFQTVHIKLPWDKSALTNKSVNIPNHKIIKKGFVPPTYVPGRNTIFLSYAISYAETIKAGSIFLGINAVDFSSYPDCTGQYLQAMQSVTKALKNKIKIHAPIEHFSKAQIIKLGTKLKVPYEKTWTCYSGTKKPCGICDSCKLRAKGFEEVGINDPALK